MGQISVSAGWSCRRDRCGMSREDLAGQQMAMWGVQASSSPGEASAPSRQEEWAAKFMPINASRLDNFQAGAGRLQLAHFSPLLCVQHGKIPEAAGGSWTLTGEAAAAGIL